MDNPVFNIANQDEVRARVNELKDQPRESRSRLAPTLKKLWNPERELKIVTDLAGFAELRSRFPNFSEAIDIYEANAIGLSKIGAPYEAQPVLLVGEPGLGKTLFVSALAKVLGLPYFEIALSTVTAGFALSGGSLQWASGDVGFICRSLSSSPVANGLFILDEIDKCSTDAQYNPMNSFYTLLERHTASRFVDEAIGLQINASRVIWVATANCAHQVPEAILSRLRVIEISKPDEEGLRAVIASVYQDLRKGRPYGRLLESELRDEVIDALTNKVPREVRQALEDGMLKAIMASRDHIKAEDLPVRKERRRAGFN